MLNIDLSRSVVRGVSRSRLELPLEIWAERAMRVRGHTAKADEARSLLSFHSHASLRIKGDTQAGNVPLLVETQPERRCLGLIIWCVLGSGQADRNPSLVPPPRG